MLHLSPVKLGVPRSPESVISMFRLPAPFLSRKPAPLVKLCCKTTKIYYASRLPPAGRPRLGPARGTAGRRRHNSHKGSTLLHILTRCPAPASGRFASSPSLSGHFPLANAWSGYPKGGGKSGIVCRLPIIGRIGPLMQPIWRPSGNFCRVCGIGGQVGPLGGFDRETAAS